MRADRGTGNRCEAIGKGCAARRWDEAYRAGMKTHSSHTEKGAGSDAHRAAVCFGFVALVGGGAMLGFALLALALGVTHHFVAHHHALGLVALLAGLFGGSAWFDRWERRRDGTP